MWVPSTTGADYMDYLVADKIAIPPGSKMANHYTEKILYMPDVCMVNNYRQDPHALRVLAEDHMHMDKDHLPHRDIYNLPEDNQYLLILDRCIKLSLKYLQYG